MCLILVNHADPHSATEAWAAIMGRYTHEWVSWHEARKNFEGMLDVVFPRRRRFESCLPHKQHKFPLLRERRTEMTI